MITIVMDEKQYETILLALERSDENSTGDKFKNVYDEIALDTLSDEIKKG